ELVPPLREPRLEVGCRNLDLKLALEAVGKRFFDFQLSSASTRPLRGGGCGKCLYPLVRAEGFEPPRLSSREPKSRASTNSATPAKGTLGATPMSGPTRYRRFRCANRAEPTCVAAGRRGLYHA